jgi:hypothetical protein
MKATDLLKQQHEEVSQVFEKFEKSENLDEQGDLFEQVAGMLAAHDAIEREIFYPACKEAKIDEEILGESLVEHGVVEFSVYRADLAVGTEDLPHFVKVLKEMVEHHVEEEEEEFFPKVEKAFSKEQLEELGARMEKRFEEALQSDFREAIRANLEQVLQGAMETDSPETTVEVEAIPDAKPAPKKKAAAKKTASKSKSGNGRAATR